MNTAAIDRILEEGLQKGAYPGAVLVVSQEGECLLQRAVGHHTPQPGARAMEPTTIFDLASLTKPLATTLSFLILVDQGRVSFDDQVARFFPNFAVFGKSPITFRHLLVHSSGLPAHRAYFERASFEARRRLNFLRSDAAKEWILQQVHQEKLEQPPGQRAVYSDLGFMLLGQAIETISQQSLDRFCRRHIFEPLGLGELCFRAMSPTGPSATRLDVDSIAPTQQCPWRQELLRGEVDDENAWAMGGVAGHAGLFGTAPAVDRLAAELDRVSSGHSSFLPQALVEQMWTADSAVSGSTRTLGWDTPAAQDSLAGKLISRRSVGHLGFTGTSIWIDRERHLCITFLTNRVHPARENKRIRDFRPRVNDAVLEALA